MPTTLTTRVVEAETSSVVVDLLRRQDPNTTTNLILSGHSLLSLSSALPTFIALERLNLSSNHLHSLPQEMDALQNLRYINLRDNAFRTLPTVLGTLRRLEILDVSKNSMTVLPRESSAVGSLLQLRVFSVAKNRITLLPPWIATMDLLNMLKISENPIRWPEDAKLLMTVSDDEHEEWLNALKQYLRSNAFPTEAWIRDVTTPTLEVFEEEMYSLRPSLQASSSVTEFGILSTVKNNCNFIIIATLHYGKSIRKFVQALEYPEVLVQLESLASGVRDLKHECEDCLDTAWSLFRSLKSDSVQGKESPLDEQVKSKLEESWNREGQQLTQMLQELCKNTTSLVPQVMKHIPAPTGRAILLDWYMANATLASTMHQAGYALAMPEPHQAHRSHGVKDGGASYGMYGPTTRSPRMPSTHRAISPGSLWKHQLGCIERVLGCSEIVLQQTKDIAECAVAWINVRHACDTLSAIVGSRQKGGGTFNVEEVHTFITEMVRFVAALRARVPPQHTLLTASARSNIQLLIKALQQTTTQFQIE